MYNLLQSETLNKDKVRQFAELKNNIKKKKAELRQMEKIASNHKELNNHCWKEKSGLILSIYDMTDNHLKSIVHNGYIELTSQENQDFILQEFERRGFSPFMKDHLLNAPIILPKI